MTSDKIRANKALIANILRAYSQGDLGPLLGALAEGAAWEIHAHAPHYRFGGARKGRAEIVEAAAMIAAEYAIHDYTVKDMVAEGDVVWTYCEASYTHLKTERQVNFAVATRWELRGGKIVTYHAFFDSAHVLAQEGRLATA